MIIIKLSAFPKGRHTLVLALGRPGAVSKAAHVTIHLISSHQGYI